VEGYPFTWFKSLGTPRAVEERLDRALANQSWFNMYPDATLENLVAPASDHYPIMLHRTQVRRPSINQRSFRFENAWKLEPGFDEMVKECWLSHSGDSLIHRQNNCAADMWTWSRNHYNKLKIDIEDCRRQLDCVRNNYTGEEQ
jgi:hypothetical protein